MSSRRPFLFLLAAVLAATPVIARDKVLHLAVDSVTDPSYAQGKLDGSVSFYFAGQKTPAIALRLGEGVTNRKTNSFGKGDEEPCRWAMLSALMQMQEEAKAKGANAVIDIVSYYKKKEFSSPTDFECHGGNVMVGVALKGDYVKIGKR